MLAGAGDELQGIKKGIMEMADGVVITKADGENLKKANQAQAEFQHALHLFSDSDSGWKPKVITSSALEKSGIKETWQLIEDYLALTKGNGFFNKSRDQQNLVWFQEIIQQLLKQQLAKTKGMNLKIQTLEKDILAKKILPSRAAKHIIDDFFQT
jgi:LAO/AO transport system kinase